MGNLPHATTEESLRKAFEEFGQVEKVKIIIDRETGRSRGFGFVDMPNDEQAQAAIAKMHGQEFEGRTLTVNEARADERPARPRFEGGRNGGGPRRNNDGGGFRSRF